MNSPVSHPPILVVEDDPMVLATVSLTLEREHFEVVTAPGPVEGLQLVAKRDFGAIISDFRMRQMNGIEFLVECRRLRPHSARVLFTALDNVPTVVQSISRGDITSYIAKPWKREQLIVACREGVKRHAEAMQAQAAEKV